MENRDGDKRGGPGEKWLKSDETLLYANAEDRHMQGPPRLGKKKQFSEPKEKRPEGLNKTVKPRDEEAAEYHAASDTTPWVASCQQAA